MHFIHFYLIRIHNKYNIGCPANGQFWVHFGMDATQNGFTNYCMMKYLELHHSAPNSQGKVTFSHRSDVNVTMPGREAGNTKCLVSSIYLPLITYFLNRGYTANHANATFLGKKHY